MHHQPTNTIHIAMWDVAVFAVIVVGLYSAILMHLFTMLMPAMLLAANSQRHHH